MKTEAETGGCCPVDSWAAPLNARHDVKSLDGARGESTTIGTRDGSPLEIYAAMPDETTTTTTTTAIATAADDVVVPPRGTKAILVFTDV